MRKPNYSVAHERENQRRRVLEEEEEERERLRRAIAEEKQERKKIEYFKNYKNTYDYVSPPRQPTAGEATNENIMVKMFERILAGSPPSIRVIARFGQSNYDITITKPEELEAVQAIVNKFINAFQPMSNNF